MNNYLDAIRRFTCNEYSRLIERFKKFKSDSSPKIRIRVPKLTFKLEEIIYAIESQMDLKKETYKAMMVGKTNVIILLDNIKENIDKILEKATKIKIKEQEITVISSKWKNFTEDQKIKKLKFLQPRRMQPRYKVIFKGFLGSEKDMTNICKELGEVRSTYYEKNFGIKNGTVIVEFNSIKDPMLMKIDILEVSGLPAMFLKWYENGIRQIGFMQQKYEESRQTQKVTENNEMAIEALVEDSEEAEKLIEKKVIEIEKVEQRKSTQINNKDVAKDEIIIIPDNPVVETGNNELVSNNITDNEKEDEKMENEEKDASNASMHTEENNMLIEKNQENNVSPHNLEEKINDNMNAISTPEKKRKPEKSPDSKKATVKKQLVDFDGEGTPILKKKQSKLVQTKLTQ